MLFRSSLAASATEMQATAQTLTTTVGVTADEASSVAAASVVTTGNVQTVAAAAEFLGSCHFRRPALVAVQVLRPAAAAIGEVVAIGDQALVQMACQLGDAVRAWVVPEEVAGHAHLSAPAGAQHRFIQPGPLLDRLLAGGPQP